MVCTRSVLRSSAGGGGSSATEPRQRPCALALRFVLIGMCCGGPACGSKTGLLIPELDSSVCEPRRLELLPATAEVMLVLDRSTSMQWVLDDEVVDTTMPSRWELLGDALGSVLTPLADRLDVGAIFFPAEASSAAIACSVAERADIIPGSDSVDRVLEVIRGTAPQGGTPTGAAMDLALQYVRGLPPGSARPVLILATDGAPNCNDSFEGRTCSVCTSPIPETCNDPESGWVNCLDDVATLTSVRELFEGEGVPVYVIGIGDSRAAFREVLQQMAVAGGRPVSTGDEQYYTVRRPEDLQRSLEQIIDEVTACRFALSPRAVGDVQVHLGDTVVPLNSIEGWNHPARDTSALQLFGSFCSRYLERGEDLVAEQVCPP